MSAEARWEADSLQLLQEIQPKSTGELDGAGIIQHQHELTSPEAPKTTAESGELGDARVMDEAIDAATLRQKLHKVGAVSTSTGCNWCEPQEREHIRALEGQFEDLLTYQRNEKNKAQEALSTLTRVVSLLIEESSQSVPTTEEVEHELTNLQQQQHHTELLTKSIEEVRRFVKVGPTTAWMLLIATLIPAAEWSSQE